MRRRRVLSMIGIVTSASLAWWVIGESRLLTAKPVPAISFTTISGTRIELASWRGKPVVVTFWATSCPTCLKEIPEWRALYRDFHARGLEMIAIAVAGDVPSRVVALTQAYALPYPVALDPRDIYAQAFGGVAVTPMTFLIDPHGAISQRIVGPVEIDVLRARIAQWLNS